jgi:hypothetical protein
MDNKKPAQVGQPETGLNAAIECRNHSPKSGSRHEILSFILYGLLEGVFAVALVLAVTAVLEGVL